MKKIILLLILATFFAITGKAYYVYYLEGTNPGTSYVLTDKSNFYNHVTIILHVESYLGGSAKTRVLAFKKNGGSIPGGKELYAKNSQTKHFVGTIDSPSLYELSIYAYAKTAYSYVLISW